MSMMKCFVGILFFSGYHTLPSIQDYWASAPALGLPILRPSCRSKKLKNVCTCSINAVLIRNYNVGMGGVDLHDNAVVNYRVNVVAVNAWKLHCFVERREYANPMLQKYFRNVVTTALLLTSD